MAKPGLIDRLKERKRIVEDESTLDEGEGLQKAREKEQSYDAYPSDKEVERPMRKSEGGRYHNMPDMIGTDEDAPPRKKYMKKRPYQE